MSNSSKKPVINDYGITREMLDSELKKYERRRQRYNSRKIKVEDIPLFFWWLISMIIFTIIFVSNNKFAFTTSLFLGSICGGSGVIIGLIVQYHAGGEFENRKNRSRVQTKYNEYLHDLKCYEAEQLLKAKMKKKMYWISMSGHRFEKEIAQLFSKSGYATKVTKGSGDGGVDIILEKNRVIYLVQCKNHKKPVAPATVRDLYGAMSHEGVTNGILVSTMGFTQGVYTFVRGKNIELVSLEDILKMAEAL